MTVSFYLKYRPQKFLDLDSSEAREELLKIFKSEKIPHALLFSGPRGIGKTSAARIVAKAVNCEKVQSTEYKEHREFEPCNQCDSCISITNGTNVDILEIDAASNRGIDDIKELREKIKLSPASAKYKVYIIDEAHMLTPEAFNALLKTLEEPPKHAIFILCTTDPEKLPKTIISRCQRFDFHKLPLDKIVERLDWISQQEKVSIEKPALELIALNADGSVRDGESLLGQVMAMEDNEITLAEVQAILGVTDIRAVQDLVEYLTAKKNSQAIVHINQVVNQGYDLVQFSKSLVNYLRKMLLLKVDPNLTNLVAPELTKEQISVIMRQGQSLSQTDLIKTIHLFIRAGYEIKSADFPQLPLELAVVEFIGE